ncbi:MAG: hypothetical protein OEW31_05020, partial [Thermoleophilia bacterium]|nr:hypothetical protein [Thermoleophilia bacterium]
AEASELTGLSKRALARRIERGQLRATKEDGLRYVDSSDLVEAGLLDPATGRARAWAGHRIRPDEVAKEIVETLVRQSVELHELRRQVRALIEESRHDDVELRTELERARDERQALRRAIEETRRELSRLQVDEPQSGSGT